MSLRFSRIVALGLATLVIAGSATSAFAIRNRYTNEQNEGFTGLLFGDYGYELPGQRPVYRPYAPVFGPGPGYGYDGGDVAPYARPRRPAYY